MHINKNSILADFREQRCLVPKFLSHLGFSVQFGSLATDYVIGSDCFVERKTISDFITSIADGRLFRQVAWLARSCKHPLLLLEGGGLYHQGRVSSDVIRGVILWITVTKKVSLVRTCNEEDSSSILRLLAKKYSANAAANLQQCRQQRKIITPWQRQINILTQISGIGRQTASDLLTVFKTIDNLAQASDIELMSLPRMGKSRLKSFRQIFPVQTGV
ncbi:MAG: helix-hairpin-helix domain-containing protein [Patescibacteria group bacterium]|nr:helix-hairpin-helix domain-containing protein [Patescibacteria group bacterium]